MCTAGRWAGVVCVFGVACGQALDGRGADAGGDEGARPPEVAAGASETTSEADVLDVAAVVDAGVEGAPADAATADTAPDIVPDITPDSGPLPCLATPTVVDQVGYPTPENDWVAAMAPLSGGDLLLGVGSNETVAHLRRVQASGAAVWDVALPDSSGVWDIVAMPADGAVALGTAPTPSNLPGFSQDKALALRIDATGQVVWKKLWAKPGTSRATVGVALDDGLVVAVVPLGDFTQLERLDGAGATSWIQVLFMGQSVLVNDLASVPSGGFVAALSDYGVARLSQDGELVWKKSIADFAFGSVVVTPSGGFVAAGSKQWDAAIVAFDAQGQVLWQKTYAPPGKRAGFADLVALDGGDWLAVGGIRQWAESAGGFLVPYQGWVVRLAADGALLWSLPLGLEGGKHGLGSAVLVPGGIVAAGETTSSGEAWKVPTDAWLVKVPLACP